ncbi:hypothetical protein ABN702_20605 [Bacillus haimaensis]|uniref:hypothetical protein n=1 Tax=Bacillus haimaensis TaxID=3160967 RepID=UPI003AA824E0
MLIFGVFKQSIELEQALAELENLSILSEHILVVFMNNNQKEHDYNHSPHAFEIGIASGTGASVIGASIGFELTLCPIIWGLIAAFIGFCLGVSAFFLVKKLKKHTSQKSKTHEVTIVIQCQEDQTQQVSDVLWKYNAISVGYADNQS